MTQAWAVMKLILKQSKGEGRGQGRMWEEGKAGHFSTALQSQCLPPTTFH